MLQLHSPPPGAHDPVHAIALFQAQACDRLLQAYLPFGGVMSGDELVARLAGRVQQPISQVAHWIVDDRLIHFSARGATCIPHFQFDGCAVRPLLQSALAELRGPFDAFEVAQWFVTPNALAAWRSPAELVLAADAEVVAMARADRYLAGGS
jgi:hypothetical protein